VSCNETGRRPRHPLSWATTLLLALVSTIAVAGCSLGPRAFGLRNEPTGRIRLIITTDEHDWLEPHRDPDGTLRGGVAEAYAQWREIEGLGNDAVVLLSSGDLWTGPYESTMLRGEPMLRAFNRMGYRAAAIGNHNFDFGIDVLEERARAAAFPFLAANLRWRNGKRPSWALPWTIIDVGALRLGVIGLAYRDTPHTTHPRNVEQLQFLDYRTALEREVPRLRRSGADEIVLLMHDDLPAARDLLPVLRRLGIHAVGTGHVHLAGLELHDGAPEDTDDDVIACNGGPYLRTYCRIDLTFSGGKLAAHHADIIEVARPAALAGHGLDAELLAIVADAKEQTAVDLADEVLVEAAETIPRADGTLARVVTEAWLERVPQAEVAITNAGGVRQDLDAGPVRVRDVISVLPFRNQLVICEISGEQLAEALANPGSVAAGVSYARVDRLDGQQVVRVRWRDGRPVGEGDRVRVIINDFMYWGGDGYRFREYDPTPEATGLDWRHPVIAVLRTMGERGDRLRADFHRPAATDR
jgi:2',3'-cyclic-nucleotide 2'-phosphodiesterase (5'-nucleotidase family)